MLRKAKRRFQKEILMKSKSNPKAFWSYTKRKMKTKTMVAPLLSDSKNKDSLEFDDEKKANILLKQFSSVFINEGMENIPKLPPNVQFFIIDIIVVEAMVIKELKKRRLNLVALTKCTLNY